MNKMSIDVTGEDDVEIGDDEIDGGFDEEGEESVYWYRLQLRSGVVALVADVKDFVGVTHRIASASKKDQLLFFPGIPADQHITINFRGDELEVPRHAYRTSQIDGISDAIGEEGLIHLIQQRAGQKALLAAAHTSATEDEDEDNDEGDDEDDNNEDGDSENLPPGF